MNSEIKAPYNFVPLSNWIFSPSWAEQVSQDIPFEDGLSGSLFIDLTAISPVLIGHTVRKPTRDNPGLVEFVKAKKEPFIPATSLKGMLRSVFEIANFGRMNKINDRRSGIRDFLPSVKAHYRDLIDINHIKAGILTFDRLAGRWTILEHKYQLVTQKEIISCYGKESIFFDNQSVADKYNSIPGGLVKEVYFKKIEDSSNKCRYRLSVSNLYDEGFTAGRLVLTGQPGKTGKNVERIKEGDKKRSSNKYFEYIFFNPGNSFLVPEKVFSDFLDINEKIGGDWGFWKASEIAFSDGIPVFFQENEGVVSSFGLSRMYKLPYKNSIVELIKKTSVVHSECEILDFADVIFGKMDDTASLKGRVNITPGRLVSGGGYHNFGPVVLSLPKESYFPIYLEQSGGNYKTYMNDNARIRGWKRYILKGAADSDLSTPPGASRGSANYSVSNNLMPIREDSVFSFKLHFHNLKPVELGALVWMINFGSNSDRYHSIGMGKPFGLGTVQLKITDVEMFDKKDFSIEILDLYSELYVDFMDDLVGELSYGRKWSDTDSYLALEELTKISSYSDDCKYMSVENYTKMKRKVNFLPKLRSYGLSAVKTSSLNPAVLSGMNVPVFCGFKSLEDYVLDRRAYRKSNIVSENIVRMKEIIDSKDVNSSTWKKRFWKLLTDFKNEDWADNEKDFLRENLIDIAYDLDVKRASKYKKLM